MVLKTSPLLEETAKAASAMGRMFKSAKEVTKCTLSRKFLEQQKEEQIGTFRIEMQALGLEDRSLSKRDSRGKIRRKVEQIKSHRDKRKVVDILKLKLKYVLKGRT